MAQKNKMEIPWVEKYRPVSLEEMALPTAKLNRQKVDLADELKNFIKSFFKEIKTINEKNKKIKAYNRTVSEKKQKEEKKLPTEKAAVLLEGQPGIGKTSIVYALANDLNMEVVETNASDTRTRDTLEAKLKETSKSRGIMDFITESKKKLILIDEVDGIYGTKDRGAVPAIMDIIKDTQFPIILCANDYKSNLSSLYNMIKRYEVHPLSNQEVVKITESIIKKEDIKNIKKEDIELIIEKNAGDLRGVINDLQAISHGAKKDDKDTQDLIYSLHRDTTEEIFGLIRDLFQKVGTLNEARSLTNKSDVDYNFLYKWVNENLPTFINQTDERAEAYENLSIADKIFGRIRNNMEWSLLPYFFDLFAGGVAIASKNKSSGFRRVSFPRYSSSASYSLNNAEKALIKKIRKQYSISQMEALRDFLPFLRILTNISRRKLKEVTDFLDLNTKEKNLLK
ncbi:MAG: replication factor C large subunit [Candidatus Lokiarchaeota archaeon]|nr:replication factor C large subunit [Candidatus Lokiarchaeota archaeon]MBD3201082.1 replication factor C large subunit [Candidatus Lokiarchaeota archaeon]